MLQSMHKVCPDGRPLGVDDAVNAGVPECAVDAALVLPQYSVELRAQALDGFPAWPVEEVGAELHRDAGERGEGVAEQQQLALRIQRAALHALAVPGRADFQPMIR